MPVVIGMALNLLIEIICYDSVFIYTVLNAALITIHKKFTPSVQTQQLSSGFNCFSAPNIESQRLLNLNYSFHTGFFDQQYKNSQSISKIKVARLAINTSFYF